MERRVILGNTAVGDDSQPGLVQGDDGTVYLIAPGGARVDLSRLATGLAPDLRASSSSIEGEFPPGTEIISVPWGGAAANATGEQVVGILPWDCIIAAVAYVPNADIVFAARTGIPNLTSDLVTSRFWQIIRRRPSLSTSRYGPENRLNPPEWLQYNAELAKGIYDGDPAAPFEEDDDDQGDFYGHGLDSEAAAQTMFQGLPHTLIVDTHVSEGLRAGDVMIVRTGMEADPTLVGGGWAGTLAAPADPGGLIYAALIPTSQTESPAEAGMKFEGPLALLHPENRELMDVRTAYLGVDHSKRVVLDPGTGEMGMRLEDLTPDKIDPGNGGPPTKYCFEWFGKRWGGDYPGWMDFCNELRSRGQDEEVWACGHQGLAACIQARIVTPPAPAQVTGITADGYECECREIDCAAINIGVALSFPEASVLDALPVVGAAGSLAYLDGRLADRVSVRQQLWHGMTNVWEQRDVFQGAGLQPLPGGGQMIDIPSIYSPPGAAPGEWVELPRAAAPWAHVISLAATAGSVTVTKTLAQSLALTRTRRARKEHPLCTLVGTRPVVDIIQGPLWVASQIGSILGIPFLNVNAGCIAFLPTTGPVIVSGSMDLWLWKGWAGVYGRAVAQTRLFWPYVKFLHYGAGPLIGTLIKTRSTIPNKNARAPVWTLGWSVNLCIKPGGPASKEIVECADEGFSTGYDVTAVLGGDYISTKEAEPFTRNLDYAVGYAWPPSGMHGGAVSCDFTE